MQHFIGLIHKDAESDNGVSFPDFPGVIAAGSSLDEAQLLAEEALAFHIEGLMEDGLPLPDPSSLQSVMEVGEDRSGVAILVPFRRSIGEVTLPADVLARIDAYAETHGQTRVGFLVSAAERAIEADAA